MPTLAIQPGQIRSGIGDRIQQGGRDRDVRWTKSGLRYVKAQLADLHFFGQRFPRGAIETLAVELRPLPSEQGAERQSLRFLQLTKGLFPVLRLVTISHPWPPCVK